MKLPAVSVELSDSFFARIGGWEVVKQARALLEQDHVLSSAWNPPILKGVVQEGSSSYRAGLVINSAVDTENMCSCRTSREWGTICAHSIAVGLHHLRRLQAESSPKRSIASVPPPAPPKATRRLLRASDPGQGASAEIYIILPPNIAEALARGKTMLVFEAKWRNGRVPLNALLLNQFFHFEKADLALLDKVEAITEGETPGMLMIKTEELGSLLPVLVNHPRISLGRSTAVSVTNTPWSPALFAHLLPSGEIRLGVKSKTAAPVIAGEKWIFAANAFQPAALPKKYFSVFTQATVIPRAEVPAFLCQDWPRLQAAGAMEANFRVEDFSFEPAAPKIYLELKGGLAQLEATVKCQYGDHSFAPGAGENFWLPGADSKSYSTRNITAEQDVVDRIRRAGFLGPDPQGRYQLKGQNLVLNFFAREFPHWQKEWKITLEERLDRSTMQNTERVQPRFEITSSGVQWFDLSVNFKTQDGDQFSAAEIQRLLLSGQGYTRLKSGKFALFDTAAVEELQQTLLDCAPEQHAGAYRLRSNQAGFLQATLQEQGWQLKAPDAWRAKARTESGELKLECPPLGDLQNVLRPYQKNGVAWLHFLRAHRFGGILADEMGLGKTIQTLAFIQTLTDRTLPVLVVCPTSLVWNWAAEAAKFTPNLKVLPLHGPERHEQFAQIPQHDIVVTSYALIRRDAERYAEFEFDMVVLDEAQHIKNRQTQNAQAVKALRAGHHLVLTGTPLENSVLDLWSIFDFLMPGYLGAAQDFRERYEIPITQTRDTAVQARLARRLRPFILRRTKKEAAPDLPEKIEQVSYCELNEEQRALYQQLLDASRREITEAVGAEGLARSRMIVLNALLRLRQACCDLRLLKLQNAPPAAPSGKIALFNELLEEVLDGGHRALVFSQFVSMLTLLREELDARQIPYAYLDGSTTNRAEAVAQFQQNGQIPLFLISLKAGGVGLNLTAADTVIHFDPWWNPAVEDQATGRAHRIGQQRLVNSYKLITRGTVEEKILTLQSHKRELIQAMLGGEEELAQSLSWEEIQELLR
jgi:superfamily II DNA or RNA helicase